MPNMVHSIYNTSVATLNPHRLAYFLIILAIGVCVDQRRSHRTWTQDAERFHQLSRAALCETSVINEPSIDAINALVRTSSHELPWWQLTLVTVLYVAISDHVLCREGGGGVRMGCSGAPHLPEFIDTHLTIRLSGHSREIGHRGTSYPCVRVCTLSYRKVLTDRSE